MKILKELVKEHIAYKQQIFKLAKSDMIRTYRGAALGWLWALIKPVTTIFVYWFAFTIGLRGGKDINRISIFLMVNMWYTSMVLYE